MYTYAFGFSGDYHKRHLVAALLTLLLSFIMVTEYLPMAVRGSALIGEILLGIWLGRKDRDMKRIWIK